MEIAADDVAIRPFDRADTDAVLALWRDAFSGYGELDAPHRDPRRSIELKYATQPELFFVATLRGRVVGTVMAGYDGHRGWLYSIGVAGRAPSRTKQKAACHFGHAAFLHRDKRAYSPRYAARTFGSSSICFASPSIVTMPESIT